MSFRRVVAALDTASPATLHAAIDLARALDIELLGLFVEDIDLLHVGTLRLAEVGYPTAVRRELDVGGIERGLRAKARRLRAELDARLAGGAIRWKLDVVRGRLAASVATATTEADIAVAPIPRHPTRRPAALAFGAIGAPLLLVREPTRGDARVAVIVPLPTPLPLVASAVAALGSLFGRSVLVAVGEAEAAPWQEAAALRCFAEHDVDARLHVLHERTPDEFGDLLETLRPRIVVLPATVLQRPAAWLDVQPWSILLMPAPAPRRASDD